MEIRNPEESMEIKPQIEHSPKNPVHLKAVRLIPIGTRTPNEPEIYKELLPFKEQHLGEASQRYVGDEFQAVEDERFSIDKEDTVQNPRSIEGLGGFSIVIKGYDNNLGKSTAVKLLKPFLIDKVLSGESDDYIKRFYQEAKRVASLQHPNIAKIYDLVLTDIDGKPTIGMALEWLKPIPNRSITLGQAVQIAKQIGGALDFVHQKSVVHQDVKPSNIMLREDGEYVLTDFGSTSLIPQLSHEPSFVTPDYADPEHYSGLRDHLPERMDQYALALSIAHLLGDKNILFSKDPNLYLLPSSVPRNARDVLLRVLSRSRGERYPSCTAFAKGLEKAVNEAQDIQEKEETKTFDGMTMREINALPEGPLKDIYNLMTEDIFDLSIDGNISHLAPTQVPAGFKHPTPIHDNRALIDASQVPQLKPVVFDLIEYLNLDQDHNLHAFQLARMRESFGHIKIAYNAGFAAKIAPSGEPSASEIVYTGITKSIVGGDEIGTLVKELADLTPYTGAKKTLAGHLKAYLPIKGDAKKWTGIGYQLQQKEGKAKVDFLIELLKGTEVEQAKEAYNKSNNQDAYELLLQFISANPQLELEVKTLEHGLVTGLLNDGDEYNGGVIRTRNQLPSVLSRAICYNSLSATRTIYSMFKEISYSPKKAFVILDQSDTNQMYTELSHELSAWIIGGFWFKNRGGDWRAYIENYFSEDEQKMRGLNRMLDDYYILYSRIRTTT